MSNQIMTPLEQQELKSIETYHGLHNIIRLQGREIGELKHFRNENAVLKAQLKRGVDNDICT